MNTMSSAVLGASLMVAGCNAAAPGVTPTAGCDDVEVVSVGQFNNASVVLKSGKEEATCDMAKCLYEKDPTPKFEKCSSEMSLGVAMKACADQDALLAKCDYNNGNESYGCLPKKLVPSIKDRVSECLQGGKFIGLGVDPKNSRGNPLVSCTQNENSYCTDLSYYDGDKKSVSVPLMPPCDLEGKMGNAADKTAIKGVLEKLAEATDAQTANEVAMMCAAKTSNACGAQVFMVSQNRTSGNPESIGWCTMGLNDQRIEKCDAVYQECLGVVGNMLKHRTVTASL